MNIINEDRHTADGSVHDLQRLKELQALSLDRKIGISIARIVEWYNHWNGNVFVAFSGGKDSTALLHLVRSIFPEVPGYFINTGLEYPEIQRFAKSFDNIITVRPKMRFDEVLATHGYPLISQEVAEKIDMARINNLPDRINEKQFDCLKEKKGKGNATITARMSLLDMIKRDDGKTGSRFNNGKWLRACMETPFRISSYCCHEMKKKPNYKIKSSTKLKMIIGTLASESILRTSSWVKHGCNLFDGYQARSEPMAFWTEQDVLQYLRYYKIDICSVYGDIVEDDCTHGLRCSGCQRTGCMFCCFGMHINQDENQILSLYRTHPKQYDYCMRGAMDR